MHKNGDNCITTVFWKYKSSIIRWQKFMFYGSAEAPSQNEISDRKTDDLPPQITILNTVYPYYNFDISLRPILTQVISTTFSSP